MDIFDQINSIPIKEILNRLWIKFREQMGTLHLKQDWRETDWWKANVNDWYVADFAGKRAEWDRITFIMWIMNISKHEAITWYKNSFNLIDDNTFKPMKEKIKISKASPKSKNKWDNLTQLTQKQLDYLKSRQIDYSKILWIVKNYDWMIAIRIYNERWEQITIQRRWIDKKEFRIEAGTESNWIYMDKIDENNKTIYVVEWMFDFLSLRQYTTNVVWLVSAKSWIDTVKAMYDKGYNIVLIPDNDEVWKEVVDKFEDIDYSLFDLENYEVKDINEVLVNYWIGEKIIEAIEDEKIKKVDKDEEVVEDIDFNTIDKVIPFSWGCQPVNEKLWLLDRNKLVIFAWEGWSWKTTYTLWQAVDNANNWLRVTYMSLEMSVKNLIISRARKIAWIEMQKEVWEKITVTDKQKEIFNKEVKYLQNNKNLTLVWYDKSLTKDTFEQKLEWLAKTSDLVFIDNLWMIWRWQKESELLPLLTQIMLSARSRYKCTIIALHHMSKWTEHQIWARWKNAIRWSWKVLDDADNIITIARDEEKTLINSVKDRENWILETIELMFHKGKFVTDNL